MARTQLLDQITWDVCLTASGNIAIADSPYATAQDVACACRTWLGEMIYATNAGIPYLGQIFGGNAPSVAFVKAQLETAALTVPGVTNPVAYLTALANRKLSGTVQFIGPDGTSQTASF